MFREGDMVRIRETGEVGVVAEVRWPGPFASATLTGPQYGLDVPSGPTGAYEGDLELLS